MLFSSCFFVDIKRIDIAHEFTLDRIHKCQYPFGRGCFGLVYILDGQAEYRFFTGEHINVAKGDLLFLPSKSAYVIETLGAFRHYTVNFDIHTESSSLDLLESSHSLLQNKNSERFEMIFKRLVNMWNTKKTGYEMQAVGILYELLSIFFLEYTGKNGRTTDRRLLSTKEYIEQNFDKMIRLEDLAKLAGMSVTNFRREWSKRYPEPPMQYRDSIRLYYAKEYLNSGYYTVSEVAEKCGFEDASYFVRFFKKKTGVTPGCIKKK